MRLIDWEGNDMNLDVTHPEWHKTVLRAPSLGIIYEMSIRIEPLFWLRCGSPFVPADREDGRWERLSQRTHVSCFMIPRAFA